MRDRHTEPWIVSKYAFISWSLGRIEIASPISGVTFQTDNPDVLHVIHAFAQAKTIEEVVRTQGKYPSEQILACIDELIDVGILIQPSEEAQITSHHWEQSALAFHQKSRHPKFQVSLQHKTTAVVVPRSQRRISLGCPLNGKGYDFVEALESRCSRRTWTEQAIARETFSSLLWMSARNRDCVSGMPHRDYVSRPYPSGGAAYSLELYPVLAPGAVESILAGVYRYLPESHELESLSEKTEDYFPFLEAASRSAGSDNPPIVLVITSRFARKSERYGDLAYSLVLKEVGALFQTLYLVAEYLELSACALGGGAPAGILSRLCNTCEFAEPLIGEFMLGAR
jgi:SagB-type dehydrogenase family enzyme